MQTLVFAPETINIAETTRMIEIAKASRDKFHCVFFGYSDKYSNLIEQAGFEFRRMNPWLTNQWLKRTTLWIKPSQRVARYYGVPPINRLVDIYEGDFNLVTVARYVSESVD